MGKRGTCRSTLVALVASIALVVGLVPAQALAEAADELAGQNRVAGTEATAIVDPAPVDDAEKVESAVPAEGSDIPAGEAEEPAPTDNAKEADQAVLAGGDGSPGGEDADAEQSAETAGEAAGPNGAGEEEAAPPVAPARGMKPAAQGASKISTLAEEDPTSAYTVRFDANVPANASTTCSGIMEDQSFACDEEKALSENGYSLPGYEFTGWNTKADGAGTTYANREKVHGLSEDGATVTLYAQWWAKPYTIEFWPGEIDDVSYLQTAYFDQPGTLEAYSDEAFGWSSSGRALHGWSDARTGSLYGNGASFVNLCGAPNADGNPANVILTADWVLNGQIVVTVTKNGAPQAGLEDELTLFNGSGTAFSVPISYERGKYAFDPSQASWPGTMSAQLPPGEYDLTFDAPGYPTAIAHITYRSDSAASVVFAYHTVTYKVVDGTWADGTTADKTEVVRDGALPADIPKDMVADEDFTGGAWDADPGGATIVNSTTFTYTFDVEQVVLGVVPWRDNNNELGMRPEKVTVYLLANGEEARSTEVTASQSGLWAFSFDKLPPFDAQRREISYSVAADEIPGYTLDVEQVGEYAYHVTYATKPILTITPVAQTLPYNGQMQGPGDIAYEDPAEIAAAVTVEGLQEGDALSSVVLDGQGKDADVYGLVASSASVVNASGETVTDDYIIDYAPGTLTIEPAKARIAVDSASKIRGNNDPAFTGTVKGLVTEGDLGKVRYFRTNTDEAPGTYAGVLDAEYTENANYDVSVVKGDFTIKTPAPVPDKKGTLTFDLAGGALDGKTGAITIKANIGDTIKLPGAPTRKGYTFKYWKGSQYAAGASYKVEGDHVFTAVWEKKAPAKSGDSGKKSHIPATGDGSGPMVAALALAVIGAVLVLRACAVRRRADRVFRVR